MPDKIFNSTDNKTYVFDDKGHFVGSEPGDITGGKVRDPSNLKDYTSFGPGNTKSTDWGKYVKDNLSDLVPAATTMAVPELRGASPFMNVLAKMGISLGAGTATDQLANAGSDKPLLDSGVHSLLNSVAGIGLPELANIGLRLGNIQRTSTTTKGPSYSSGTTTMERSNSGVSQTKRSNSGSSTTSSESGSTSKPLEEMIPTYIPGPNGKFGKTVDVPTPIMGTNQVSNWGTSTTQGGGQGVSDTTSAGQGNSTQTREGITIPGMTQSVRDAAAPGWLGHMVELAKHMESFKYNARGTGAPNISPLTSSLLGLALNLVSSSTSKKQ